MAAGKPVVVSNAAPLERIVRQTQCGVVYKDYDNASLIAAIRTLEDPERRSILGENARRAVNERYNWSHDKRVMLDAIASLKASSQRR